MRGNRRRDTLPELAVRRELFARGLRYRVDYPIRVDGARAIRADIAFTGLRIAVFVDGCFWHGCPEHATIPTANRDYWKPKLERNIERDREGSERLREAGWTVLRVWEHENAADAAATVAAAVQAARGSAARASR